MTHLILHGIFAVIAVLLTVIAPNGWNSGFIYLVSGCFFLQNLVYWVFEGRKNNLRFELFFFVAFFFVNFAYPLLYYLNDPLFLFYCYPWPSQVICRATAIANLGYAFYMLGLVPYSQQPTEKKSKWEISSRQFTLIFLMMIVCFVLYLAFGGLEAMRKVYGGGSVSIKDVGVYSYFYVLFTITAYLVCILVYRLPRRKWWFYLLVMIGVMVAMLSTGSRTLALGITTAMLVGWNNNFRKFRLWEVAGMLVGGVFVLFMIVQVRKYNLNWVDTIKHIRLEQTTDVFGDLIVNGRNLYVLVDYGLTHSYTFFHGMLIDIGNILPGMAKPIMRWTGDPYELLCAQDMVTYLTLGKDSWWGLGCNMIGDAFRSFGYVGTAVCMWLIGWSVKTTYQKQENNIYIYTIHYLLIAYAIFYTRAPILFPPRMLFWTLGLLWCTSKVYKSQLIDRWLKKYRKEGSCE